MAFRPIRRDVPVASTPLAVTPPASSPADALRATIQPPPRRRIIAASEPAALPVSSPEPAPANKTDYTVGKNKPPVHTRWQKGKSGNPKGRPKGARNYDTIALEILGEKVPVRTATGQRSMDTLELAFNKLREQVGKGDIKAIVQIMSEMRRLMPAPVVVTHDDPSDELTAAEQQLLARFLDGQGLAPMVIGMPAAAEQDVLDAIAARSEDEDMAGEEDDDGDDADEEFLS